jgi:hypothetical protein
VNNAAFADAYGESVREMESATEQRVAMERYLARGGLTQATLAALLRVVPSLRSDGDRRVLLERFAAHHQLVGAARSAYVAAARSIKSEDERAAALAALARGAGGARTVEPPAAPAAASSAGAQQQEHVWNANEEIIDDEAGLRVRLRVKDGQIATLEDRVPIGFLAGGFLFLEERRGDDVRSVRMTQDGRAFRYDYRVDGESRPFDAAARRWMEQTLRRITSQPARR